MKRERGGEREGEGDTVGMKRDELKEIEEGRGGRGRGEELIKRGKKQK
jgi:hypothetical protein